MARRLRSSSYRVLVREFLDGECERWNATALRNGFQSVRARSAIAEAIDAGDPAVVVSSATMFLALRAGQHPDAEMFKWDGPRHGETITI
ncbi:hypothetical protein JTZ10_10980 [Gordonia rubripertincta]|uniref:Uncharacterized protein n=1 Tax=Gordonia rubripertincta TaxID=36822 RepID=A0AAW4G456_GORRU|nr:hypothetical protein [Gordonia rubripertincta]MBM7278286.1 hypothetical protein [Gordonia rubripertincta]